MPLVGRCPLEPRNAGTVLVPARHLFGLLTKNLMLESRKLSFHWKHHPPIRSRIAPATSALAWSESATSQWQAAARPGALAIDDVPGRLWGRQLRPFESHLDHVLLFSSGVPVPKAPGIRWLVCRSVIVPDKHHRRQEHPTNHGHPRNELLTQSIIFSIMTVDISIY